MSANTAAAEPNARKAPTPPGRPWSALTVIRVRSRLAAAQPAAFAAALAATYRAVAFFRLSPIAGQLFKDTVERGIDTLLWAAPHFGIDD